MSAEISYPLLLAPTFHVKVWGGRKLADVLHKSLPTDETYGESWEFHDTATVINGCQSGRRLGDLLAEYGTAIVGEGNDPRDGLPLLAKLLDAADWLSIQVHPDDEQAAALEGQPRGKTEAWIILATDPTAKLVIGIEPGTSRETMAHAIESNTLDDLLVIQDIQPGDVFYIPAGTVHAIGPGTLLYEIQQSSNTTYRLYDWGRMGLDGNPRELHIEKGVQVSNLESVPTIAHPPAGDGVELVRSPYFTTVRNVVNDNSISLDTGGRRFHILTCITGSVTVQTDSTDVNLEHGQSALIPAIVGSYTLAGKGAVLRSFQPD